MWAPFIEGSALGRGFRQTVSSQAGKRTIEFGDAYHTFLVYKIKYRIGGTCSHLTFKGLEFQEVGFKSCAR